MPRPLALLLCLLVPACNGPAPAGASAPVTASRPAHKQHADELAAIDQKLAGLLARADADPKGWITREQAADLYLTRARLSGSYDDYAHAEAQVDRAFAIAGDGLGPFFTRVRLDFTLHRLDRVAADLERIEGWAVLTPADRAALVVARADLAFQRGRYDEARTGFEAALAAREDVTNLARLALYRWKTGEFLAAEDLYHRALALLGAGSGEPGAWLHLQLGLMDLECGRWDDALAHYHDGTGELGGYWLIDEHIAEIQTLRGETDAALAAYADIVARTGNPEFMDAIAAIHRAAGRPDAARPWIERAGKIYAAQLERFPEAAYGHALAHYLEFGEDPARTLEIAEANHRVRPNAEAKISLARANLGAGRIDAARERIDEARRTPWKTAEMFAVAAEVYAAAADTAAAAEARQQALAIDPHALD